MLACALGGAACAATRPAVDRPATWAQPLGLAGVPDLHKVSDTLYRSGQPTAAGMRNLERMGIKTVLNLRSFHSDRDELAGTGLRPERLTMKAWHPERKEAVEFLRIAADPQRTPVLVHCQHGADRTGAVCALYRIAVDGWTKDEAIREITRGGFGLHGVWRRNLEAWIRRLDVEAIRREAGITGRRTGAGASVGPGDAAPCSNARARDQRRSPGGVRTFP